MTSFACRMEQQMSMARDELVEFGTYAIVRCRNRDSFSMLRGEVGSGAVDCLVRDGLGLEV